MSKPLIITLIVFGLSIIGLIVFNIAMYNLDLSAAYELYNSPWILVIDLLLLGSLFALGLQLEILGKLFLVFILSGAIWWLWAWGNCLSPATQLEIKSGKDLIQTIQSLTTIREIRYAEDPFTADKFNAYIECEDKTYSVTLSKPQLDALEIAGVLVPALKPHQSKMAFSIWLPIGVSIALLVIAFRRPAARVE